MSASRPSTRSSPQPKAQDGAKRLLSIPGIGALNATALVAAIGDAGTFARGRDLAAWLGLVPRQVTTGGRPKLLGITKRGSKYLRKMLIQGARAALPTLRAADTPVGAWLRGLLARAHLNTAVVALAAKMPSAVHPIPLRGRGPLVGSARTVWAKPARAHTERSSVGWAAEGLLRHGDTYKAAALAA